MVHVVRIRIFGGKSCFHPSSPLVVQATPCETETKSDVKYRNQYMSLSDSLVYSIQSAVLYSGTLNSGMH